MKKEIIKELKELINKAYDMSNDSRISLYIRVMEILDYYDENTTIERKIQIKKEYRKLAKKYHPDTNQGNKEAEICFKEVNEAYDVLSDPEKKKVYDRFGHAGLDGNTTGYNPYGNGFNGSYSGSYRDPNGNYREYHFEGSNMDDIFGDVFGDMFRGNTGSGFGGQSFRGNGSRFEEDFLIGEDYKVVIEITENED